MGVLALAWPVILMSACERSEERGPVVKATESIDVPANEVGPAERRPPDAADSDSGNAEAGDPETLTPERPAGETEVTGSEAVTDEQLEGPEATESEPEPPPEDPSPDPNPTPIDGLKLVVTESGLKYWDIREGDGEIPEPNAYVDINWRAWFADGTLFDSSAARGDTRTYSRRGVIQGLYEGVWSMRVGGIRRLEVPPHLAYGEKGRRELIPPNATLTFEVELVRTSPRRHQEPFEHLEMVKSPSGLKYWDFEVGEGARPEVRSIAEIHYAMWLFDGTLLADTQESGVPAKSRTDILPAGWREGLATMRVGGRRRLEIPPELGYGTAGEPYIPTDVGLILEVELLGLESAPAWPAPGPLEGVEPVTTSAGLTYWDLEEGHGRRPDRASEVLVHFTGWLSSGTMYESSLESGDPVILRLSDEVAGLVQGMRTMKIGGKRRLRIPPELGYGEKGRPGLVPPNETLTIEVELFGFTE